MKKHVQTDSEWQEEMSQKIIDDVKVAVCPECGNIEMYLENLTNLKD